MASTLSQRIGEWTMGVVFVVIAAWVFSRILGCDKFESWNYGQAPRIVSVKVGPSLTYEKTAHSTSFGFALSADVALWNVVKSIRMGSGDAGEQAAEP